MRKDNFHVDLNVNVVDSKKQRVIHDAQIDFLRNANVFWNDVSYVELNVVSNEMFHVASTSSIQDFFIKTSVHKIRNVFLKNTFRIIFKMSNARVSKTIRLIEFILWFENVLRNILRDERNKVVKKFDFY
jgi:hypothetical protein